MQLTKIIIVTWFKKYKVLYIREEEKINSHIIYISCYLARLPLSDICSTMYSLMKLNKEK